MKSQFQYKRIIAVLAIIAIIILCFSFALSSILEIIVLILLGILAFGAFVWAKSEDNNPLGCIVMLVAIALFGCCLAWHDSNNRKRDEKKRMELLEVERQYEEERDAKEAEEAAKRAKEIEERSKKLYAEEGNRIFGEFYFGMSQNEFKKILNKIEKETNGRIRIGEMDFVIDYIKTKFTNDKLSEVVLRSTDTWIRYYYLDAHEYDDIDGGDDGKDKAEKIFKQLEQKYGPRTSPTGWEFNYKIIDIRTKSFYRETEGLLRTEDWGIEMRISQPAIIREQDQRLEEEAKAAKAKADALVKERLKQDSIMNKKKESFADGI